MLRFATAGSVDDGKSTLVGRLLHDSKSVLADTLEAVERAYIMWVLQTENGNKTRAAEALGIDPSTLYRKLSRYGVEI